VGAGRHPPTKAVPPWSSRPATRLTGNIVSPGERAEAGCTQPAFRDRGRQAQQGAHRQLPIGLRPHRTGRDLH
jgi:hypothetical protein